MCVAYYVMSHLYRQTGRKIFFFLKGETNGLPIFFIKKRWIYKDEIIKEKKKEESERKENLQAGDETKKKIKK
jgi:hypothetical protein